MIVILKEKSEERQLNHLTEWLKEQGISLPFCQ